MSRRIYGMDDPQHERHMQNAPPPEAPTRAAVTIQLPPLDFRAAVGSVDGDKRTADVVWTTGQGVWRQDYAAGGRYLEILSLDPRHVNLERLNSGAPVLNSHNAESLQQILGVVVEGSARLVGPAEARATLRFSRRADVQPIFEDIRDGIFRAISVGYRVEQFVESRNADKDLVRTAVKWTPYELSLVALAADAGAKVRAGVAMNTCEVFYSDEAFETERQATSMYAGLSTADADHERWLRLARAKAAP